MYTLKELCDKAYQELLDSGLSKKSIDGSNRYIWNRLISQHGPNANFDAAMVYDYCKSYFGRDIFSIERSNLKNIEGRYIKAFTHLIDSANGVKIQPYDKMFYTNYKLSDNSSMILDEYIKFCKNDGNSETTLKNKYNRIKRFIIEVDFDNISINKTNKYLLSLKERYNPLAYPILVRFIRRFLVFAYEKSYINKDILMAWPQNLSSSEHKSIPSVYSIDEINTLLNDAKDYESEDNHLRNYAILCLITYSGIRVSDVSNLKLSNINWRTNIITFVQQKTKKSHNIPLIPSIGNPIVNYIVNERVKGSDYLFVKENGNKMTSSYITNIINNYFRVSKIQINNRHYGPHALRHSLATNLINKSVDAFSIANVLGHSNINSVKIYAKVDLINLRKCVLEAPYA